jgi:hypothetical protein
MKNHAMTHVLSRVLAIVVYAMAASAAAAQEPMPAPAAPSTATCIAMSLPSVQGADGSATHVAAGVRDLFTSFLQGPSITIVSLETRLAVQASEEARQKSCDRLLIVSLTRKRGGGNSVGRILGQAGATAAWYTPVGSAAGAAVRGAAVAGVQAASEIAATTRAKDEMRLTYRLVALDGRVIVKPKEERAKAKTDGEDLLTPLVQAASEAIAAVVITK